MRYWCVRSLFRRWVVSDMFPVNLCLTFIPWRKLVNVRSDDDALVRFLRAGQP